jgi:NADPH:quinone reductase-like Zn-dependent oxidoreductase
LSLYAVAYIRTEYKLTTLELFVKAIVVEDFEKTPVYDQFPEPEAGEGEVKIAVSATTLSPLVRLIAQGKHYSGSKQLPFVPGMDGVGRLSDGSRVYFLFPRNPFGSMAEFCVVHSRWCVGVPDDVDDVTAAAVSNSGSSSWIALTHRAEFKAGQTVLINGATGSAGQLAVRIAKHLGAAKVIATGRNPHKLESLKNEGVDVTIPLGQADDLLAADYEREFHQGVDVVLDYLGGHRAEHMINAAIKGRGSKNGEPRVRFVQIGAVAGKTITVDINRLRSSGLELLGSGLGAFSVDTAIRCAGELMAAIGPARLSLPVRRLTFAEVEQAWADASESHKIVLGPA